MTENIENITDTVKNADPVKESEAPIKKIGSRLSSLFMGIKPNASSNVRVDVPDFLPRLFCNK